MSPAHHDWLYAGAAKSTGFYEALQEDEVFQIRADIDNTQNLKRHGGQIQISQPERQNLHVRFKNNISRRKIFVTSLMSMTTRSFIRFVPAVYFLFLGIVSMVMEFWSGGASPSLLRFCLYAMLFLPGLAPTKLVWTVLGMLGVVVFGILLMVGFGWLIQYLNGTYFRYPFDTFVVGLPFNTWNLSCALWMPYLGLTSKDSRIISTTTA